MQNSLGKLSRVICFIQRSPGLRSEVQSDSENVLSWIPVPNGERQQKQGSGAYQLRVTCTSELSPE